MVEKITTHFNKNKYLWYSFGIPLILFFILYYIKGVVPFGEYSATLYDSSHQYIPFLTEYYTKLKEGSSIQFSLSMGLGQDFFLIWSYYLSSPINLLLLLFKKQDILIAINLITAIKISLCSLSATYYLKKKCKKLDLSTLAFGLCYGLSSYVMAYFYNIMWMDVVFAFPILILFFERMLKNEKYATLKYSIVLAYCLITNFYLSIPVCLFLIIYFLVYTSSELKDLINKSKKFASGSIIGALLAGFVLIPNAYYFLTNSERGKDSATFEVMENFFVFLSQQFYLVEPQVDMSFTSGANLYCGTICIFFLFLYAFNSNIKKQERIKKLILILFLILSMNIKVLNYIWHGFDYPTGYVNRLSFIYMFVLIDITYECFTNIKRFKISHIMISSTLSLLLVIYCYIYERMNKLIDDMKIASYILTIAIMLLCFIPIYLNHFKKITRRTLINTVSKIIICEMLFYGIFSFSSYGLMNTENSYKYSDNYHSLINSPLYEVGNSRSDIDYRKLSNESTHYGLNGVSFFSSTVSKDFASVIDNLGHRGGTNFYSIKGNNALTQILFDIKYLLNDSNYYSNFSSIEEKEGIHLYKNNYDTSLGYLFDTTFEEFKYDTNKNPFILQNDLVSYATNNNISYIYKPIVSQKVKVSSGGADFTRGSYKYNENVDNDYICKVKYEKEKDIIYELNFKYICENENDIVINIDPSNVYACNVKVNGSIVVTDYKISDEMVSVGNLSAGDEVVVNIKVEKDATEGKTICYFAEYAQEEFDKFYNYITKDWVEVIKLEDGKIELNVESTEEKILFLSLPYLEGWKALDNGKEIEIIKDNYFTLIKLKPGEHNITLTYNTPYLNIGIIVSTLTLILCISFVICSKKGMFSKKEPTENISEAIYLDAPSEAEE